MKRIVVGIMLSVLLGACGADGEENGLKDDVLSGTRWEYSDYAGHDDAIAQEFDSFLNMLNVFSVDYRFETGDVLREEPDTTYVWGPFADRALEFGNGTCRYIEERYTMADVSQVRYYERFLVLEAKDDDPRVQVKADGLYLNRRFLPGGFPAGGEEFVLIRKLENYRTEYGETGETLSAQEVKINVERTEEQFDYSRTLNEIVLSNAAKKWIGKLDTTDWTISFVQIVPEKQDLPTFSLK